MLDNVEWSEICGNGVDALGEGCGAMFLKWTKVWGMSVVNRWSG